MSLSIEDLKWRIYNVYPARRMEIDQLLSILDIRYSSDIPTAAVRGGTPPRLTFNPEFVETYCKTDESLLMITMHEIYHVVLGHTRLFPLFTMAHNIAFDAVINAMICKSFPEPAYTRFFTSFYPVAGVTALLRPPDNWIPDDPEQTGWKLEGKLLRIHKALYTDEGDVTYRDIFDSITQKVSNGTISLLLGNHSMDKNGKSEMEELENVLDHSTVKIISEIVSKWPAIDPTQGRDQGLSTIHEILSKLRKNGSMSSVIRRAVKSLAEKGTGNAARYGNSRSEGLLPYPTMPDRKAAVMSMLGQNPVFFKGDLTVNQRVPIGRVHVYIDVSGSMDNYIEDILGSLSTVRDVLYPRIHCFSTIVETINTKEVLTGKYKSTYGTNIDCVIEHAGEKCIRKAVIITDGFVGEPSEIPMEKLPKGFRTAKVLVPPHYSDDLSGIPGNIFKVNERKEIHEA